MGGGGGKLAARPGRIAASFEEWLGRTPATIQTLRALVQAPTGSHITDLERRVGDPMAVIRTLHHLQNAGLVQIQLERESMDLVVKVAGDSLVKIEGLLHRLS